MDPQVSLGGPTDAASMGGSVVAHSRVSTAQPEHQGNPAGCCQQNHGLLQKLLLTSSKGPISHYRQKGSQRLLKVT